MILLWNSLISNIALLATNLQVPGEDFVLIQPLLATSRISNHFMSKLELLISEFHCIIKK